MFSPLEQFNAVKIWNITIFDILDISIYNIIFPLFLIIFIVFFFFFFLEKSFYLIPKNWQCFFENLYNFILDIIEQQVGKKGISYFPFLFTLFIFILISNFLGLIPLGIALTSHFIFIFFLSFTICISFFFMGLQLYGIKFLRFFIPEAPFFLLFLLIPIEIFSYAIRCLSLAVRLCANILAGHTLVFLVSGFLLHIFTLNLFFFFLVFIILLLILLLEFGVAFLQAYVFLILVCIYLNDILNFTGSH